MAEELKIAYAAAIGNTMHYTDESYLRHRQEEDGLVERMELPRCYTDPDSIGNWHHERMLRSIQPLLAHSQDTTWMTVGDGRFGSDAHFLRPFVRSVTATSIAGSTLEAAKQRGWIDDFSEENAEKLSFADNSFDFVFCKETFHHFPRPALGFYEMLRVARLGVVLIEPMESFWNPMLTVKRVLRREHAYDEFEPSGNFIYRLDVGELAKKLTALNMDALAWKGMNTFWHEPFDCARKGGLSMAWLASGAGISAQDIASRIGLLGYGVATAICFKSAPEARLAADLRAGRFHIRSLPRNPYVKRPV